MLRQLENQRNEPLPADDDKDKEAILKKEKETVEFKPTPVTKKARRRR